MELLSYFAKSFLILFLFLAIYQLLLRNDAHYKALRFFLLLGLLTALFLPLAELTYTIHIEPVAKSELFKEIEINESVPATMNEEVSNAINWYSAALYFYLVITSFFLLRIGLMLFKMFQLLRTSRKMDYEGVVVCINSKVEMPFVFGKWIFIKHEHYLSPQHSQIINHERVHLYQQHWIDVLISELFIVFQWFNPLVWYYARLIKQNLEFLADRGVLESGHNYEDYIQTIICETMGAEALVLANHFRFSQNKRRLKMMKNDKKSKWRLLKLLLVLPLIGGLLWAFSEPVYAYRSNPESINDTSVQDEKEAFTLKGLVVVLDTVPVKNSKTGLFETKVIEEPLTAAAIILKGTKIGTVSATDGSFALPVEVGNEIVVSFVGYETKSIKITNTKDIYVIMNKSSIELEASQVVSKSKNSDVKSPKDGKEVFYIVEDMPSYKGGEGTFAKKLQKKIDSAKKNEQLTGKVKVQFIVDKNGQLQNIKAISRTSEKEAKYAIRFIAELNEWYPGKQRGKAVDCQLVIPVEFN